MQRVHSMASAGFLQALAAKMVAGSHVRGVAAEQATQQTVHEGDSSEEEVESVDELEVEQATHIPEHTVLPTKAAVAGSSEASKPSSGSHLTSHETLDTGVQIFTYGTSSAQTKQTSTSSANTHKVRSKAADQAASPSRSRHAGQMKQQLASPSTVDTASSFEDSPGSQRSRAITESVKSFKSVSTSRSQSKTRRNYTFREYLKRHVAATT